MLCKSLNVQLAIIGGGLTGDAQLGDRVFMKRFKRVQRNKLLQVMREKWRDAKKRQISRDGYIYNPHLLRPNAPDRIEQINLIVSAWKLTVTSDIENKTNEVRMKCYELAQETGWTPAMAFQDIVTETGLEKELRAIRNTDQSAEALHQQESKNVQKMTCMAPKCGKRSIFNFEDEAFPKFCEAHKYEGMIEVAGFRTHHESFGGAKEEVNVRDIL